MKFQLSICLLCLVVITPLLASNNSRIQLSKVKQQISQLKESLAVDKQKREKLAENLAKTEQDIGVTAKNITQLEDDINKATQRLTVLNKQADQNETALQTQTALLKEQINIAYRMGRHQYLKLLLNQQNPADIGRLLHYLTAISKARLAIIHAIQSTLRILTRVRAQIQEKTQELQALKTNKQQQRQQLIYYKQSRQQLLSSLNETINSKEQRLSHLKLNAAKLQLMVHQLAQQALQLAVQQANFPKMRGTLRWPIHGKIVQAFGLSIAGSSVTTNGVLLAARQGTKVKAIYPGKVVFADWLSGYGLLVIVQHGKHYMTLYGHNQSLYAKKGDVIKRGELLATVGNSGGFEQNGLYFEIRHDGKPVNPRYWCRR